MLWIDKAVKIQVRDVYRYKWLSFADGKIKHNNESLVHPMGFMKLLGSSLLCDTNIPFNLLGLATHAAAGPGLRV